VKKNKLGVLALCSMFSCQLLFSSVSAAGTVEDAVDKIKQQSTYNDMVSDLTSTGRVTNDDVDSFISDVVNNLNGKNITGGNISNVVKEASLQAIKNNDKMKLAIIESVSDSDLEKLYRGELPSSLEPLKELFKDELLGDNTGTNSGGGGGVVPDETTDTDATNPEESTESDVDNDAIEAPVVNKTFADVKGHWAQSDIEFMASKGFVNGLADNKFEPNAQITRAQFVAILVNMLGTNNTATIAFNDVPADAWYAESVRIAYGAGLAKGLSEDKFGPNEAISREQMAAMIVNAMNYKNISIPENNGSLDKYIDSSSIAGWAKSSVAQAAVAGVLNGKPVGDGSVKFAPKDKATRAEATVMLKRFNQLLNDN
jgi:hypothetical protein